MMFHKMKAFTLIELIVVIAIIGILMAILVPNLINYLRDSRTSTCNANASQVYKFANSYLTKAQIAGASMDGLDGTVFAVLDPSVSAVDESFTTTKVVTPEMFQKSMSYSISSVGVGAVFAVRIENRFATRAWWAESTVDHFIGCYPVARSSSDNVSGDVLSGSVPANW
jgi:prepilin-type N-terminal cleavage/methylation domain-containing protein